MKKIIWCFLVLSAYANSATIQVDRVVSVYDADTFRVDVDSWPPVVGSKMPIRVNGIDAPEIRGKCEHEKQRAREARDYVSGLLASANVIELRNIQRGKYFRLIADVYIDDVSLAERIIDAGYARRYDGGKRLGWCD